MAGTRNGEIPLEPVGPGEGAKGPDPFFGQKETDSWAAKDGCEGRRFT